MKYSCYTVLNIGDKGEIGLKPSSPGKPIFLHVQVVKVVMIADVNNL